MRWLQFVVVRAGQGATCWHLGLVIRLAPGMVVSMWANHPPICKAGGVAFALLLVLAAGCATRRLPPYEEPLARAEFQRVRTTAYTHDEADHKAHGRMTALGTQLRYGPVRSAAADWSRWPAGTQFLIVETGEVCEVDDYGWALSGTNTIDLYKPSIRAMNGWGTHRVTIQILRWGDPWRSYSILKPRRKYAHVRRMADQIEERYERPWPVGG